MNLFNQYFLQIVLLAPLAAILHISFIKNIKSIKLISFFYSIFILLLCFILIIGLSKQNNTEPFQFVFAWNWFSSLSANYGVDGISVWFILLTAFLIPVCLLTSWESISFRFREFVILLFFIEFILFQVFSVLNILLFYIGFEAVLIPMFIMIGVWGSRKRKISASYQFFLYTFLGSVAMLASIAYIYNTTGTLDYLTLTGVYFDNDIQIILWLCFFVAFAVKTPMVPIHT